MIFKILGVAVEADLFNPDKMADFETAISKTVDLTSKTVKGEKASESIRRQCQAVIDCLDQVFGENTAVKILGERTNLLRCLDAFEDVCFIHEQMTREIEKRAKRIGVRAKRGAQAVEK